MDRRFMRGKWGWATAGLLLAVLAVVVIAPGDQKDVAEPVGFRPAAVTTNSSAPSVPPSPSARQNRAAAEARARADAALRARAGAAQQAAAARREWAALSRAGGSTARFEYFTVSLLSLRRADQTRILARVCVNKRPDPSQKRTRVSWDPWSISAAGRTLEPQRPSADLEHAFPAEGTYRVGRCALGWLVFGTDDPVEEIIYANGVGEQAVWDGTDMSAPPETTVIPPEAPAEEDEPESLDESATDYANCADLREDYPHGVGGPDADDETKNNAPPVKDFEKSQSLYEANRESDRDDDGVACEQQ